MVNGVTVHLIRHEKTDANLKRKYIGWTDEPIVEQVEFSPFVQSEFIYGSDLIRCQQTANGYFPEATFIAHKQLRELNFGDFEMKTYEQLQHDPIYRAWIDDPYNVTPPNGEDFEQFKQRVISAFMEIVEAQQNYIFVVHGGVIRVLLSQLASEEKMFQQVMAQHRMVYTLHWDSLEDLKGGARCTSYSEAHITENMRM
ncbi:histidine phosphatase family protein [Solibacillus sp. FSL R7-0668]|uniref:histidine phosphatase family protein n=1 Tax=Solibacillus sp. FSL R7-0668 TaxID=2921688 RepID=UPI0030FBBD3C